MNGSSPRPGANAATIKTLTKALSVLDLFTVESPEWSVTEIGRTLELPVATTHRIVRSLADHKYLRRTGSARYRLDAGALDLGTRALRTLDVRSSLHTMLRTFVEETNETILLSVYDERRGCARCVDRVEASHALRLSLDIGECTPLHAGASSKAVLASLDRWVVEDVLSHPLERVAPKTIVDPGELRRDLDAIARRGWAYSYEETDVGAWGVAAPVRTRDGNLVAVVGIAAPTARHSESATARLADAVTRAAATAAQALDPRLFCRAACPPSSLASSSTRAL